MFSCTESESTGQSRTRRSGKRKGKSEACACCTALSNVYRQETQHDRKRTRRRKKKASESQATIDKGGLITSLTGLINAVRGDKPNPAASAAAAHQADKTDASANGSATTSGANKDGTSTEGPAGNEHDADWIPDTPKVRKLWHGIDGIAVTAFGIAMPAILAALSAASMPKRITLMLLNHPLETAVEILLVAMVPVINYLIWNSICKNKLKLNRISAVALGAAAGSSVITFGVCVAAIFAACQQFAMAIGTDFTMGFAWIACLSMLACASSGYLLFRVRSAWELASTRRQIVACAGVGFALTTMAFAGAEAKSWIVRAAEKLAVAQDYTEASKGMALIRQLNPERELRMECSDARAAGLAGLFIPIKTSSQHELYFRLTGKPYSFREFNNADLSSMPDEYLSRNVVGERVKGLSLARSTMNGAIHPNTLTATINWTFVFKNDTSSPQDMRAELGLPPGAVVNGLTVWTKGEPTDAQFVASEQNYSNNGAYAGFTGTGMATDLGHGRVLVQAFPIPQDEEAKIRVSMVVPLNPDATKSGSLVLPKFIATNFDLQGDQMIRLHSSRALTSGLKTLANNRTKDGEYILEGRVSEQELQSSRLVIEADRPSDLKPVYIFDKIATEDAREQQKAAEERRRQQEREERAREREEGDQQVVVWIDGSKGVTGQLQQLHDAVQKREGRHKRKPVVKMLESRYVVENVKQLSAAAPKHLVVVVDGSASVGPYVKQLTEALAKLPKGISASLVMASKDDQQLAVPTPLQKALSILPNCTFIGGQDNLEAVVHAAEVAGDAKGGAVLWVHGPQPTLNHEIYIMSPYASMPAFYELPVRGGDTTDTVEFFRNHSDIGPFTQVARTADKASEDLQAFFKKWESNNTAYEVALKLENAIPAGAVLASADEAREIIALRAAQERERQSKGKHPGRAQQIATQYSFVSPASSAIVPTSGPELQGATNGTIGPQGADATVISGVNTAGTVRVNNLANLEALLNIIANLVEVGCALAGAVLILHGMARNNLVLEFMNHEIELSSGRRITIGVCLILIGLAVPGMLNWFVASARDANLFS